MSPVIVYVTDKIIASAPDILSVYIKTVHVCHLPDNGGIKLRGFCDGCIVGVKAYVSDTFIVFLAMLSLASTPVLSRYSGGILICLP